LLLGTALALRLGAAWALGGGAPFGPDGTGVEAAVHLGGHLYPAHVGLVALVGSAQHLSVFSGSLSCLLLWAWGRRVGLGGAGGWLMATLPLAVYTSALSAGDAPALLVVLVGALLATGPGWVLPLLGGALALASVAVKPVALPALVLLLARPRALVGLLLALGPALRWLAPLLQPRPDAGLLGSWWVAGQGRPPSSLAAAGALLQGGLSALVHAPAWTLAPLLLLALSAVVAPLPRATRAFAVASLLAALAVAAAFGPHLEPRYLAAAVVAALPACGSRLPRPLVLLLALVGLGASAAVISQVGAERAARDPQAEVPALPVLPWPEVDARALFDEASTDGATALRQAAARLATELPAGATVRVRCRAHGREGELTWPLRVARPDLRIEVVGPDQADAW